MPFSGRPRRSPWKPYQPALGAALEQVRERPAAARTRVRFDLPPRSIERLNTLKRKTEAASYAEVVKNALRLYEALIEETEAGRQSLVRDANGSVAPLRLFL